MKNILTKVYTRAAIPRYATFLCFFALSAHATSITLPYSFTAGSPISASQMMGNFSSITSALSSTTSSPWVPSSSNIYFNAGSVGIGSSAPTHTLEVSGSAAVSGAITALNLNTAPIFSTFANASRYTAATANIWSYTGESLTVTVPPGPTRYYRIHTRQMIACNANAGAQIYLSTSPSTPTGTPTGMGFMYINGYNTIGYWTTATMEGYVALAGGSSYTYYVLIYAASTSATLANASTDNGMFCTTIAWPT